MDDSEIVELYLRRDGSAISRTSEKYGTRIRHIANQLLNEMSLAEECENDTYLKAWDSIPPNEPLGYLFSFLGRIVRNLAIDECWRRNAASKHVLFCELTGEMEECILSMKTRETFL